MCLHEKVHADYILTSHPPQNPWVCKKCGEIGTDIFVIQGDKSNYENVLKIFTNNGDQLYEGNGSIIK